MQKASVATLAAVILFCASAVASLLVPTVAHAAVAKHVRLLGFSVDESVAAWRIDVKHIHPGKPYADHYILVKTVGTANSKVVRSYRTGPILRRTKKGNIIPTPKSVLSKANPAWVKARPAREWQRIQYPEMFQAHAMYLRDNQIQIQRDGESRWAFYLEERKFVLRSEPGSDIAMQVYGRVNTTHALTHLGYLHLPGRPGKQVGGELQFYYSNSGTTVAALVKYWYEEDPVSVPPKYKAFVKTLPGEEVMGPDHLSTWRVNTAARPNASDSVIGPQAETPEDDHVVNHISDYWTRQIQPIADPRLFRMGNPGGQNTGEGGNH